MSPCSIPHLTVCLPGTAGFARLRRWVAMSGLSLPLPKVAEFLIPALQIERQRNYKRNYRTMFSQTAAKAEKPLLFPPRYFPTLSLRWAQGWNESLLGKVTLNRETISWLSCSLCWMKGLIQGTMASAQGELTFEIIKFTWNYSCSLWGKQDEKTVNWFLLILKKYYYLFIFLQAIATTVKKTNLVQLLTLLERKMMMTRGWWCGRVLNTPRLGARAKAASHRRQGNKWESKCAPPKNSNRWCHHPRTETEQKSAHGSNVIFPLWHWIS